MKDKKDHHKDHPCHCTAKDECNHHKKDKMDTKEKDHDKKDHHHHTKETK